MKSSPAVQNLFVYGTLRRDHGHELNQLLSRHASLLGPATLQARLYLVEDFPGAVASGNPRDVVHGEVYVLQRPGRVLPTLDEYEECDAAHPDRGLYRREKASVVMGDGRPEHAWVYFYNKPTAGMTRIESGDFATIRPTAGRAATRRG